MAGIGFELKKIFKEESFSSAVAGVGYSTVVTIGPTIVVILTLLILYAVCGLFSIPYTQRELLSSTILYCFIFSVIFSSPFNAVISRYIADKIYAEKFEDILPSFYSGLFTNVFVSNLFCLPFLWHLYSVGNVGLLYIWQTYGLFLNLIIVFFISNYLVATKEYKIITGYYLVGMAFTFFVAQAYLYYGFFVHESILYGMTAGFMLISLLSFAYVRKYFHENSKNYLEFFWYCKKHYQIFLTNLFYTLGLYIHNFIFWFWDFRIIVADSFISSPTYDMASCLAMFSNISIIIIFTIMTETKFHDVYQEYNQSVIASTYEKIYLNKKRMFRLLVQQLSYLIMIQIIISCLMFLLINTSLVKLGFGSVIIAIYPILSAAYFGIFMTYCLIIFLYYFDDRKGAFITATVLFVAITIATLISRNFTPDFYGVGPLIGSLFGWTCGYFRIRYLEKHFDEHIFCNAKVVKFHKEKAPGTIVFTKGVKK